MVTMSSSHQNKLIDNNLLSVCQIDVWQLDRHEHISQVSMEGDVCKNFRVFKSLESCSVIRQETHLWDINLICLFKIKESRAQFALKMYISLLFFGQIIFFVWKLYKLGSHLHKRERETSSKRVSLVFFSRSKLNFQCQEETNGLWGKALTYTYTVFHGSSAQHTTLILQRISGKKSCFFWGLQHILVAQLFCVISCFRKLLLSAASMQALRVIRAGRGISTSIISHLVFNVHKATAESNTWRETGNYINSSSIQCPECHILGSFVYLLI